MKLSAVPWMSGVVLAGIIMLAGCAAERTQSEATSCGTDYTCLTNTAFHYRQQAEYLSALAERYDLEADVNAKELGQDTPEVKHNRTLAKQFWSEAEQADELAREYRQQLPHNLY